MAPTSMLRSLLLSSMLLSACAVPCAAAAERPILKPQDFRPVTELPWDKYGASQEDVMDTIFREPNAVTRYMLLQLYLEEIPPGEIGPVFDLAIKLEGSETPDVLVECMLRVWASREPFNCWARVQKLFLVVGLGDGWLMFDDWDVERSSLQTEDRAAIQASPFRLKRGSLTAFPVGVEHSKLSSAERVRLMKEFVQQWFVHFDSYPDSSPSMTGAMWSHAFREAFKVGADGAETFYKQHHGTEHGSVAADIALRRWMVAEPAGASYVMGLVIPEHQYSFHDYARVNEFLRLWTEVDRPGVMKWADSKDAPRRMAITARGMLMSEVDVPTRERWISGARGNGKDEDDLTEFQLECWSLWHPQAALAFAITSGGVEFINAVADAAISGPYGDSQRPMLHGLEVVGDSDLRVLPREVWEGLMDNWGMSPMEGCGGHNAGATARFGIAQLEKYGWSGHPKDEVIDFFAGKNNEYRDNSSVIDRTFCSLRVWAVTKPSEMKAWVATLKDDKLREALTWLADNPRGPGRF